MALNGEKSFFEREKEEIALLEKRGARKFLRFYDFGTSSLRAEIKKHPGHFFFLFITSFLGSVITSGVALFGFSSTIIAQFAAPKLQARADPPAQVASPKVVSTERFDHLLLASKLRKGEEDFLIIDVRSQKEYDAGHIVTAKNIPIYETEMITDKGDLDTEKVLGSFEGIEKDKLIILYGQNSYATIPSDTAFLLEKAGKSAKALAIGWEEWEHLYSN